MEPDCVLYDGHVGKRGYGLDYDPTTQKTVLAHRLVFRNEYGYLPKVVLHKCDTPACVNPQHLVGGTQADNIQDCVTKGRFKYVNRKLTPEQVLEIRTSSMSQRALGKKFQLNQRAIWDIIHNNTYRDITGKGGSCGS